MTRYLLADEHSSAYVIPVDGGNYRRVRAHETDILELAPPTVEPSRPWPPGRAEVE